MIDRFDITVVYIYRYECMERKSMSEDEVLMRKRKKVVDGHHFLGFNLLELSLTRISLLATKL